MRRALLVTALLLLPACGDAAPDTAPVSCDGRLEPADPAAMLPAGVPAPDGAVLISVEKQGATTRWYGRVAGTDLVLTRDRLRDAFAAAGYTIVGSDQEAGTEADLFFTKGDREGSVQVAPLCDGNLRLRWRLG